MRPDLVTLKRLSCDPNSALTIGKAAEHLVCANLLLSGYRSYLSDQGLPYDVVVDFEGRLFRIQVKGSCFPRNSNGFRRYQFFIRRSGKLNRKLRDNSECDLVALVALDIGRVAYMPHAGAPGHIGLMPPEENEPCILSRSHRFDEFPFVVALDAVRSGVEVRIPTRRGQLIEIDGQSRTFREWSQISGVPVSRIHSRLKDGWDLKNAVTTKLDESRRRAFQPRLTPQIREQRAANRRAWWAKQRAMRAALPPGYSALDQKNGGHP